MNEARDVILLLGLAWNSYRDLRCREIHLMSVGFLFLLGFLLQIWEGFLFLEFMMGMLPGFLLLGISLVTGGALGFGDGLMTLCLGVYLGFWATAETVMAALLLSAAWAGLVLCLKKRKGKDPIAFVPFLLLGDIGRMLL